jgi:hypothetical protein
VQFSRAEFEPLLEDLNRVLVAAAQVSGDAEAAKLYVVSHPLPPFTARRRLRSWRKEESRTFWFFFASIESGFVG